MNQLTECIARGSGAVSVISKHLNQQHGPAWKEGTSLVLDVQGGSNLESRQFLSSKQK